MQWRKKICIIFLSPPYISYGCVNKFSVCGLCQSQYYCLLTAENTACSHQHCFALFHFQVDIAMRKISSRLNGTPTVHNTKCNKFIRGLRHPYLLNSLAISVFVCIVAAIFAFSIGLLWLVGLVSSDGDFYSKKVFFTASVTLSVLGWCPLNKASQVTINNARGDIYIYEDVKSALEKCLERAYHNKKIRESCIRKFLCVFLLWFLFCFDIFVYGIYEVYDGVFKFVWKTSGATRKIKR